MIPVYSISKPFLAEAVLSLGLDLNDEIGSHLDLAPVYGRRTIGALLNHSSGLDDYGRLADYHAAVAQRTPAWPVAELLDRCEALPHANVGFQYSNIGYLLLRLLVQKQTGLSYCDALVEHVFGKVGLVPGSDVAEWESLGAFETPELRDYDPKWVYSGTFLANPKSLVPGFARLAAHRAETHGHQAGLISVPYPDTGSDNPGYNFGFMADGNPAKLVGHGGGGPGYGLLIWGPPSTDRFHLEFQEVGPGKPEFDQAGAIQKIRGQLCL